MLRPRNRTTEQLFNAATASPRVRGQLRRRAYAGKLRVSQLARCNIGSTDNACQSKRADMKFEDIIESENCQNMVQVRRGVDAADAELIALLAKRFGYMDAAARIKNERGKVRDDERKHAVITNATEAAEQAGIPAAVIAAMWEILVEGSIAYEMAAWESLRA
jgi:isochorismate pyruvate lyase